MEQPPDTNSATHGASPAFLRIDERSGRGKPSSYAETLIEVKPDGVIGREVRLREDGVPSEGPLGHGTYNDSEIPRYPPATPEFDAFWADEIPAARLTRDEFEAAYRLAEQMFSTESGPVPDPRWLRLPGWLRWVVSIVLVIAYFVLLFVVLASLWLLGLAVTAMVAVPYWVFRSRKP